MFVSNGLRNVDAFVNFTWEHDMFDLEKVHPSTVAKWKLWSYEVMKRQVCRNHYNWMGHVPLGGDCYDWDIGNFNHMLFMSQLYKDQDLKVSE